VFSKLSDDDINSKLVVLLFSVIFLFYAKRVNKIKWLRCALDIYGVELKMEQVTKDLLVHQTHVIYVHGSPQTIPSLDGNGILLNGLNQYLDAGKDIICKNNLDNCERGFTLRFQIKPYQLPDLTYFISSAPIDVYYRYAVPSVSFVS